MARKLTFFGLRSREHRIRAGVVMADQRRALGYSVSYISAIERGTRTIPPDYPSNFAGWIGLSDAETKELCELAFGAKRSVEIFAIDRERADIAEEFAREINLLPIEHLRSLRAFLSSGIPTRYTGEKIPDLATLSRAVFKVSNLLDFDVLTIVENYIAIVDPKFSLQVDPDERFRSDTQGIAETDHESVHRILASERLYNSANWNDPHSRYILAHEIAHWLLHRGPHLAHRDETLPFYEIRPGVIISKTPEREREANRFAREFLLPRQIVEQFDCPQTLARRTRVPTWVAEFRMRELGLLVKQDARDRILAGFDELIENLRKQSVGPKATEVPSPSNFVSQEEPTTARIILFPQVINAPLVARRKRQTIATKKRITNAEATGDLFEFADKLESEGETRPSRDRGLDWFDEFGWR